MGEDQVHADCRCLVMAAVLQWEKAAAALDYCFRHIAYQGKQTGGSRVPGGGPPLTPVMAD